MKTRIIFDLKTTLPVSSYRCEQGYSRLPDYPFEKYAHIEIYETNLNMFYFRLEVEDDGTYTYRIDRDQMIEDKWKKIREKRDKLLQETDFYLLNDVIKQYKKEEIEKIIEYRQELRDITEKFDIPFDVEFPEFPEIEKKNNK